MARRLLILLFTLSVAGNSLAAAAPVVSDSGCGGCCSAARRSEASASASKLCCLMDCNQPGETQQPATPSLLRTERDDKSISPVAVVLAADHSVEPSGFLHSPARSIIQATHLYFRTGALLI